MDTFFWCGNGTIFLQKIPPELRVFENYVSFAGEFIRFQFDELLNGHKKYSLDIYILPYKSVTYSFDKKQFKVINFPLKNQILECFVRINILNFDDKNKGIIPLNFYIGIAFLNSDMIQLEYCDFLSNGKFALNGKLPTLKNISEEVLNRYTKWLLLQKEKYVAFKTNGNLILK